jgi:polyphosphate kinase 2 (PPK2 family)
MLEKVDFKTKLDKAAYKPQMKALIERLVVLQQQAVSAEAGLVVLFEGWDGAGKGSRISDLLYNLDARATSVYMSPDVNARDVRAFAKRKRGVLNYYPLMHEYWAALGERGHITFFDRGWYTKAAQAILAREGVAGLKPQEGQRHYIDSIYDFERQLTRDGYTVIKFFVHVSAGAQKKRLERLRADKSTRWRVSNKKLASVKRYSRTYKLYDQLLEATNFEFAPWVLVNGEDKRAANLQIAQTMVDALENALATRAATRARDAADQGFLERAQVPGPGPDFEMVLDDADEFECVTGEPDAAASIGALSSDTFAMPGTPGAGHGATSIDTSTPQFAAAARRAQMQHAFAPRGSRFPIVDTPPTVDGINHALTLAPDAYKRQLKELQARLFRLQNMMYQARIPLVIMYEGWDAAGKGGNIKRVAQALDARAYTIFPSPAPTKPELAHPHLWRYWQHLPKAGHVALFDRSWYGRVLVERVEELTPATRWSQGYDEINEFEHDLVDWGAILLKFWVDVSPDEQLARFNARAADPAKQWKITPDDWRNRDKYPQYKAAIDDMFRLTSTRHAPWVVLESDDKLYARIKALRIICDAIESRLNQQ